MVSMMKSLATSLLLVSFAAGAHTASAACAPNFGYAVCVLEDGYGVLGSVVVAGDATTQCLTLNCFAISVLGNADGAVALSIAGDATGCVAVAVVGEATPWSGCTTCLVIWVGGVECHPLNS